MVSASVRKHSFESGFGDWGALLRLRYLSLLPGAGSGGGRGNHGLCSDREPQDCDNPVLCPGWYLPFWNGGVCTRECYWNEDLQTLGAGCVLLEESSGGKEQGPSVCAKVRGKYWRPALATVLLHPPGWDLSPDE